MFKYNPVYPPVSGWLEVELDKPVVKWLWERVDEAKVSVKDKLAGNISESLDLEDKDNFLLSNVLLDCANAYADAFKFSRKKPNTLSSSNQLVVNGFWVNFQKKHEFNPMHDHGGLYSFVIWMKIPTSSQEQHNIQKCKNSANPAASDFQLMYNDITGSQRGYTIEMDQSMNVNMLLFPSTMLHQVYPFYDCEDERVSISGNLYYNGEIKE